MIIELDTPLSDRRLSSLADDRIMSSMGLPLSDRRLSSLTDDRLSSSMGLPLADRRLSGLTDDRRSSTITAKTFNSSDMGYVSEDQPRRSLGSVSSMVQGDDDVFFNQVLPKHRRNSSPGPRPRFDDDAFFSQAIHHHRRNSSPDSPLMINQSLAVNTLRYDSTMFHYLKFDD